MQKNDLIRRLRLISKFEQLQYTYYPISQEVKAIRQWIIECNMRNVFLEKIIHKTKSNLKSRSKGNQTMNNRMQHEKCFFQKNHTQNVVERQVPDSFLKNQNLACRWINYNFIQFVFMHAQAKYYKDILKLRCWPLAFTSNKTFLRKKIWSDTRLPVSLSAWFLKKKNFLVIFY